MVRWRGTGLRLLPSPPKKIKGSTNAERCKQYREDVKKDPDRHAAMKLDDMQRCRRNYYRPRTEEELEMRRDAERQRKQAYRERKKAARAAENHVRTPPSKPKTRKSVENQREKWRIDQTQARTKWTAQKWRRHREKCSRYYHDQKAQTGSAALPPLPLNSMRPAPPTPEAAQPEMPSSTPMKTPHSRTIPSPSPNTLKASFKTKLQELRSKRSKQSHAAKRVLFDLTAPGEEKHACVKSLYTRTKKSAASKAALKFLHEVSVDLPGKKTVSKKTKKQKKVLPTRLKRIHKDFLKKNPQHRISLRSFYRLLPKEIKTSHKATYNMCLCQTCTNLDLKLDAFNAYLQDKVDGRDVFSERSLCGAPTLKCYDRQCCNCGTAPLKAVLQEAIAGLENTVVKWRMWDMLPTEKGTRKGLATKECTLQSLLDLLIKDLHPFSKHLFTFRWQFLQYKTLLSALPEGTAVAVCDFAENFPCRRQNEVQSAYWSKDQVTVHPTVLFYRCSCCFETVTDYLVFLSDDLNHDANVVKTVLDRTASHLLTATEGQVKKMVVFSDGCGAQYKSKLPFFHLANLSNGIAIERAYFGASHGKSACDACGGVVKRLMDDDIRAGVCIVDNAAAVYEHLCDYHVLPPVDEIPEGCCHLKRSFNLIEAKDIDRSRKSDTLVTVPGTRSLHSLKKVGKNILATRKLSCFCAACVQDTPDNCLNTAFVGPWDLVKLQFSQGEASSGDEGTPTPASPNTEPEVPRDIFFRRLQAALKKCKSFCSLERVVKDSLFGMHCYPLPPTKTYTVVAVGGTVDSSALALRPDWVPASYFPIQTGADGNCLPRAASRLLFGTEAHHIEVRCRIVVELVTNLSDYVQGVGMSDGKERVTALLAIVADNSGLTEKTVKECDIQKLLKAEIVDVAKPGAHMGLWQIAAFANIAGTPVMSVFPNKGWIDYQQLNNRVLQPRQQHRDGLLYIMWTSEREDMRSDYWVANHFVPLLPMTDPSTPVSVAEPSCSNTFSLNDAFVEPPDIEPSTAKVSDCFIALWGNKTFVARVDEVDNEHNLVLLNFMEFRKAEGLYVWPTPEDTSWEEVNVLRERVDIELVSEKSTHRIQMYRYKMR